MIIWQESMQESIYLLFSPCLFSFLFLSLFFSVRVDSAIPFPILENRKKRYRRSNISPFERDRSGHAQIAITVDSMTDLKRI